MQTMTVSEVSKTFQVSTRMLRYYEQMGLIKSSRKTGYAYRIYTRSEVRRLQQILIFRKLHIPLKEIKRMLNEQGEVFDVINTALQQVNNEIEAMETIRNVLQELVSRLDQNLREKIQIDLLTDLELISLTRNLNLSNSNLKESYSMEDLNKAEQVINKDLDVRLIMLPPCMVASYQYIGPEPEKHVHEVMDMFVKEIHLYEIKPDARMFGFNHPSPSRENEIYGYEDWVTIPEEMIVPAPLIKKQFEGGLYAAYTINFPEFDKWQLLADWADHNANYEPNYSELGQEIMGGCLEEHLNWVYSSYKNWPENGIDGKLDLLLPVKKK